MRFLTSFVLVFLSSADLMMMTVTAHRIFDMLDIEITRAQTSYMKSATRAPDLYVLLEVAALREDTSLKAEPIRYASTMLVKKNQTPVFNEHLTYIRYDQMRYTFGTDNVIYLSLVDQGLGYEPDTTIARFGVRLNLPDVPTGTEEFNSIYNETLHESGGIGYRLNYTFHSGSAKDVRYDDYEADVSDSPLFHVHKVRNEQDGTVYVITPDYSFNSDYLLFAAIVFVCALVACFLILSLDKKSPIPSPPVSRCSMSKVAKSVK
jgi:hypothetical protein